MHVLGAHMSIAGGYYKAVEAAAELGMTTCQIFTNNNNQWRAKPIGDEDVSRFRSALMERRIGHPLSHSSYLINLAAPDQALWAKSVEGVRRGAAAGRPAGDPLRRSSSGGVHLYR